MELSTARWSLITATALGAIGVMAGAFGAHALREEVSVRYLDIWETAAHYQLVHALALLALAMGMQSVEWLQNSTLALWSARLFTLGTVIFSGSLYALVLSGQGVLGAITPIGGSLLITAWVLLGIAAYRR